MAFSGRPPSDQDEQSPTPAQSDASDTPVDESDAEQQAPGTMSAQVVGGTRPLSLPQQKKRAAVTQPLNELLAEQDEAAADETTRELPPIEYPPIDDMLLDALEPIDEPIPTYNTDLLDPNARPLIKAHRSLQGLSAAARRDVGRVRHSNQDSVLAMLMSLPRDEADVAMGLFVVADGMGGHEGGEIASRLAIRTVLHEVLARLVLPVLDNEIMEALQALMVSAVQEANQTIWEQARAVGSDMGTTCTAVLLLGRTFYIAHVGDSRAYLLEDGKLRALTSDHSTVGRLIAMGQITPEASRTHPLRNQLYRTIGQQPDVEVDIGYEPFGNSTHLLLCSDGLWSMISEEQMARAVLQSPWPHDACDELISLANLAGGEDNISAVVVSLPVGERSRS